MRDVTIFETVVQWHTIQVEDDVEFDHDNPDEDPVIRELMWEAVAMGGWDGTDVLESRWEVEGG